MKYSCMDHNGVMHFAGTLEELQVKMQQAREN